MLNLTKGALLSALCALGLAAPSAFAQSSIKLNEILANNVSYVVGGSITDWIELSNSSPAAVDLSGASISDDELNPTKWSFPIGTTVPANGYLLIAFDPNRSASATPEPNLNTGFGIKSTGATLYLFGANFGEVLDQVSFGNQISDFSIGRINGVWKLCSPTPGAANLSATLGPAVGLKVNEWMANPSSGNDWFEIYNPGNLPATLDGLYLTDTLTNKTEFAISPLSFIGTGLDAFALYQADGSTNKGPDHVSFSLSKSGEAIGIFDGLGTAIDSITFGPQAADVSQGRLLDGSGNITTFPGTASPGRSNYKAVDNLIVNELLSHTDPPIEDAVEFYNRGTNAIDISGWFLSNKETELKKYRVPDGTVVQPHGFAVIYEGAFNNPATATAPFTFNSAHGDQVFLAQADANGNLTGYRVSEVFEAAEHGISFGRVESLSIPGDYKFVAMSSLTFGVDNPATVEEFRLGRGESNSAPKIGPIIFNEVHYDPATIDGTDNTDDEFIELYNITGSPVPLYDPLHPENHWRLQNGINFIFPGGQSIPAFGYALIVSLDPVLDPMGVQNFRLRWNVPDNVQIFGPLSGNLNNGGDSLELYKPDPPQDPPHPDAGFVPFIRVDKVNYTDKAPWPSTAHGGGDSMQRKNPLTFGNEPLNWSGAAPTPGRANSADLLDTDADGMTDVWEDAYGFDKDNPADAAQDADGDGMTNLQEFLAGTDPHNAASRLWIKSVVPATSDSQPLTIIFAAAANKSYEVQFRGSFEISTDWQKLISVPADASDRDVSVQDSAAFAKTDRYYRIITK